MPRYPSSVKAEARRLVKEGATQRTVAKKLRVTEGTISRWVNAPAAAPKRATAKDSSVTASELLSLVEVVI